MVIQRSTSSSTGSGTPPCSNDDVRFDSRSFDMAEFLEKGMAREVDDELLRPSSAQGFSKFHVVHGGKECSLLSEQGDFVMLARLCSDQKVLFFLYDPKADADIYDDTRPAFTLARKDPSVWTLSRERCQRCSLSSAEVSCRCFGGQQLASIRHGRATLGGAATHTLDVRVPAVGSDGSATIWCPLQQGVGLGQAGPQDAQTLITKPPTWIEEVQSWALEFKGGRRVAASSMNFQLVGKGSEDVLCQYAKLGSDSSQTFSLDVKHPLSTIQAFAICISTMTWK